MITSLLKKVRNRWKKIRLQPIRVFCLHHVCEQFEAEAMNAGDWMALDEFKRKINALQDKGYEFISLTKAYRHLQDDYFRSKKYVVLTFDDGYKSLKEVLPWLEEQMIPVTLFINGKYLDGKSYRNRPTECYLSQDELFALSSPLIEIGSHGWEHKNALQMDAEEFRKHIHMNIQLLKYHPNFVPFHAYTWGRRNSQTDWYLRSIQVISVYIDGMKNYNESNCIHREIL